jgi:serine/threonine-protein kinase HipA
VSRDDIGGVPIDVRFEGNAYYIERFDRSTDGGRIHTEDFAQANELYPSEKYKRFNYDQLLIQVADAMGSEAAMALIDRIIFNVGIGNGDVHAKNWSVIYRDGRTPSLAPAYDYVSTLLYVEAENIGMNLAGTKQFLDIDTERLMLLAARARGLDEDGGNAGAQMIERMREVWPAIKDTRPLANDLRETITEHMARVPLFTSERALGSVVNGRRREAKTAGVSNDAETRVGSAELWRIRSTSKPNAGGGISCYGSGVGHDHLPESCESGAEVHDSIE